MIPLIGLAVLFVLFSVAGHLGVPLIWGWWTSLRLALAGMFLLTASAHWGERRADLVRMVPPLLPKPGLMVTVTGVLEILGAVGLILPFTARPAAFCLSVLLFCLFPANIRAAREKMTIAGRPVPRLLPRTAIQIVFVTATLAVAFSSG